MEMTITRALAEIKLLEKRIEKQIMNNGFVNVAQGDKKVTINKVIVDEFNANAKNIMASINDLIRRMYNIKSAVIKSNADTTVKIGDVSYTVAEAIYRKDAIRTEKNLLNCLKNQYSKAENFITKKNTEVENKLQDQLIAACGSDKSKLDAMSGYIESYKKTNEYNFVDPINIKVYIQNLEDKLDIFETEVDYCLSQVNSVTTIDVE